MSNRSGQKSNSQLRHPLILAIAGAAIGIIAWSGHVYLLPASIFMLALLRPAGTWIRRLILVTCYYAGALWPILPGSLIFYGNDYQPLHMIVIWLAVSILLALPWAILTGSTAKRLAWSIPLCFLIESLPPLAIAGVANPIVCAGALFPHLRWYGLALTVLLATLVAIRPLPALAVTAALAALTMLVPNTKPLPSWQASNTTFGGSDVDVTDEMKLYTVAQTIQTTALQSNAKVIVFPESVVYRWSEATDMFWGRTIHTLEKQGKTIIVGAMIDLPGAHQYLNVAVIRGARTATVQQRIPVPVAMWKPLTEDGTGTPLNINGKGTVKIDGQRTAILICYEQLLVWPVLRSMYERPTAMIGIANDYWARDTNFPAIQTAALQSWARLFNLPLVTAVNR